jgi:hypothetical protein
MDIVSEITTKINNIFEESMLTGLAKASGFIKRVREIKAKDFLMSLIVTTVDSQTSSLSELALELSKSGSCVTKQAIHKKCNECSVGFLKEVLKIILKQLKQGMSNKCLDNLSFINSVTVVDSSEICLSKALKEEFGCIRGSLGVVKLQAQIDVLENRIENLDIRNARETDQGYRGHLSKIESGSLLIADLGYFRIESFAALENNGNYFLSRYFKRTNMYDSVTDQKVDLHKKLSESSETIMELDIKLGESKFPCRLVALKLDDEAYVKRIARIDKSKKKDKRLNGEISILDRWTIFVTNLPSSVSASMMLILYKLRWQIELFFKMMKSFFNLRKIEHSNKQRALLSIYASLIAMGLLSIISTGLIQEMELSLYKAGKYFIKNVRWFLTNFRDRQQDAVVWIRNILSKYACKESRRNRPSTLRVIREFSNVYA